jgi:hypothetical protein
MSDYFKPTSSILSIPLLPYIRNKGFHISNHAYHRLVNRFDLTVGQSHIRAHNAWLYGHRISDYSGLLHYYLEGREITAQRKYKKYLCFRIYGDGLFLFNDLGHELYLITVIKIPEFYYRNNPDYAAQVEAVDFQLHGWSSRYIKTVLPSELLGQ